VGVRALGGQLLEGLGLVLGVGLGVRQVAVERTAAEREQGVGVAAAAVAANDPKVETRVGSTERRVQSICWFLLVTVG